MTPLGRLLPVLSAAAVITLAGCGGTSSSDGSAPEPTTAPPSTSAGGSQSTPPSGPPASPDTLADQVYDIDGLGALKVGMSVDDAVATGLVINPPSPCHDRRLDPTGTTYTTTTADADEDGTPDAEPDGELTGPYVMVGEKRDVWLIDSSRGGARNVDGVVAGTTTVAQLTALYGDKLIHAKDFDGYLKIAGTSSFEQFTLDKGLVTGIGVMASTTPADPEAWIDGLGGLC